MKKTIITIVALAVFLLPVAVGAIESDDSQQEKNEGDFKWNRDQKISERRKDFQENKEERINARCANIEKRIEERKTRFEEGKTRRINAYDNMLARLNKLSEKLAAKGYDVAKLNADIATLETKIDKFKTDYATFIASLGQTKEFACGKSEGEFKGKLGEARKILPTLRADVKDIHDFFRTTIKADFKAIKDQKVNKDKNSEDDDSETPETNSND